MDDQQFELGLQMHRDTQELIRSLKDDVASVMSRLDGHIKDDQEVHKVVNRHTVYWKATTTAFSAMVAGLAAHLGFK